MYISTVESPVQKNERQGKLTKDWSTLAKPDTHISSNHNLNLKSFLHNSCPRKNEEICASEAEKPLRPLYKGAEMHLSFLALSTKASIKISSFIIS